MPPTKLGFILDTYTYGGSETETINLVNGADPRRLTFTGLAVKRPLPLPKGEPPSDGTFPPIYVPPPKGHGEVKFPKSEKRVTTVATFADAVQTVCQNSDIVICWGLADLQEYLPKGPTPKIVVLSKDSGTWAKGWLSSLSLCTRFYTANSTLAATAFPAPVQDQVKVIFDGFDPERITQKITKTEQRKRWGLKPSDKVVGYLGRVAEDKGLTKTVDGLKLLPKTWKAVFIGAAPTSNFTKQLKSYCEKHIPGRYKLIPWCHDVGSALAAMDVFSHPSDHEGFCNSLGEAWLAGVPTIYTQDTGSIPDLGTMGIEVPLTPTAEQMAKAIQSAYKNKIASTAQKTIQDNYLLTHYVERWTKYLQQVHSQPAKPRVMAVLGNLLTGGVSNWFITLLKHSKRIDFTSLVVAGPRPLSHPKLMEAAALLGCPVMVAGTNTQEIQQAITYTRPDVLLCWGVKGLQNILPKDHPPVVLVSHGSGKGHLKDFSHDVCSYTPAHQVAVSKEAATAFSKQSNPTIIYNGVETCPRRNRIKARSVLGLMPNQIAVGMVGRISPEKRPELLAQAIEALPSHYRAVFVGPTHHAGQFEKLQQFTGKLILRPYLSPEETLAIYPGLDCLVLPSDAEGFGLSIVEAWANKVPVVATRVGILKEFPQAILVEPNVASLAAGIKAALKANNKFIQEGFTLFQDRFTAKRMAGRWENYLSQLL